MFGCTPTEAEAQDLNLVRAILEYRDAREVLRIEEEGSEFEQQWLAKHPGMAAAKLALLQAQDTMYGNEAMANAVAALREAEKERSIQGE